MLKWKDIGVGWIINLFSVLHAALALSCRLLGYGDEFVLTLLTITMAVLICLKKQVAVEYFAFSIIIVNVFGFAFGTLGAKALGLLIPSTLLVHALSTFLTTEMLGWSIAALSRFFRKDDKHTVMEYLRWILLIAGGILVFRLLILNVFDGSDSYSAQEVLSMFFSNVASLMLLVCGDVLYMHYAVRGRRKLPMSMVVALTMLFVVAFTAIITWMVGIGVPFRWDFRFEGDSRQIFVVALVVHVTLFSLVYVIQHSQYTKEQMRLERERANMAQYSYLKLKRQVNPHFLFNSLNILSSLIDDGKSEMASEYTRKLAGLYRYMLKTEDLETVALADEMGFVEQYVDLLKIRFPEGLEVKVNVAPEHLGLQLVPCSLQLLIENAIKHNSVSPEHPLVVEIQVGSDCVVVRNNKVLKLTQAPSMGLGHKYLNRQYLDLCGRGVKIDNTEEEYIVTLPIII